jgi:hypothetical protein
MIKYNKNKVMIASALVLIMAAATFLIPKAHQNASNPQVDAATLAKIKLDSDRSNENKAEGLAYLLSHKDVKIKKINLNSKEIKQMLSESEIESIKNRNQNPTYAVFEFMKEGSKDVYRYALLWDKPAQSCVLRSQVVYAGALDTTLIKDMHPLSINQSFCEKQYK